MRTDISFTWWRDETAGTMLRSMPRPFAIGHHSSMSCKRDASRGLLQRAYDLERYHPLEEFPGLYERFAKLRSKDDAVKFIRTLAHLPMTACGAARAIAFIRYFASREHGCWQSPCWFNAVHSRGATGHRT